MYSLYEHPIIPNSKQISSNVISSFKEIAVRLGHRWCVAYTYIRDQIERESGEREAEPPYLSQSKLSSGCCAVLAVLQLQRQITREVRARAGGRGDVRCAHPTPTLSSIYRR